MIINKYLRILLINICIFICFPPAISFLSRGSEPSDKIFKVTVLIVVAIDLILLIYSINKNKTERVEVMALFGYEMTPCQPLSFRRRGESETEVTELIATQIRFVGDTALHIFDVLVGRERMRLEFNSRDLSWQII